MKYLAPAEQLCIRTPLIKLWLRNGYQVKCQVSEICRTFSTWWRKIWAKSLAFFWKCVKNYIVNVYIFSSVLLISWKKKEKSTFGDKISVLKIVTASALVHYAAWIENATTKIPIECALFVKKWEFWGKKWGFSAKIIIEYAPKSHNEKQNPRIVLKCI